MVDNRHESETIQNRMRRRTNKKKRRSKKTGEKKIRQEIFTLDLNKFKFSRDNMPGCLRYSNEENECLCVFVFLCSKRNVREREWIAPERKLIGDRSIS